MSTALLSLSLVFNPDILFRANRMKVNIQMISKPAPADINNAVTRLNLKLFSPYNKIDINLELMKALIENSTAIKIIKFLCSDWIILVNALTGDSISIPISCHRSRLNILSLRYVLQFEQVYLYNGFSVRQLGQITTFFILKINPDI